MSRDPNSLLVGWTVSDLEKFVEEKILEFQNQSQNVPEIVICDEPNDNVPEIVPLSYRENVYVANRNIPGGNNPEIWDEIGRYI